MSFIRSYLAASLAVLTTFVTLAESFADTPEPYTVSLEPAIKYYEELSVVRPGLPAAKVLVPNRGALDPKDVAVIINTADAYSIEVGEYYAAKYKIPDANIVRVAFTGVTERATLSFFGATLVEIYSKIPVNVQALVVSFQNPRWLDGLCGTVSGFDTSIEAILARGQSDCRDRTLPNPTPGKYANTLDDSYSPLSFESSAKPYNEFRFRPTVVLQAPTAAKAKQYIARSFAANATYPTGTNYIGATYPSIYTPPPVERSWGWKSILEFGNYWNLPGGIRTTVYDTTGGQTVSNKNDVLFYSYSGAQERAGNSIVPGGIVFDTNNLDESAIAHNWLEWGGALSITNNLTIYPPLVEQSFEGVSAGAAAYGATMYISYNMHVVGDLLSRPFGPAQTAVNGGNMSINLTSLVPGRRYQLLGGQSLDSLQPVTSEFSISHHQLYTITAPSNLAVYKIIDLGALQPAGLTITPVEAGPWMSGNNMPVRFWLGKKADVKFVKISIDNYMIGRYPAFSQSDNPDAQWVALGIDTRVFSDGLHELKVRAFDKNKDITVFKQNVIVNNKADTQNPEVFVDSPTPNQTLNKDSVITGHVSDDTYVHHVYCGLASSSTNPTFLYSAVTVAVPLSKTFSCTLAQIMQNVPNKDSIPAGSPFQLMVRAADRDNKLGNVRVPFVYGTKTDRNDNGNGNNNNNGNGNGRDLNGKKLRIIAPQKNASYSRSLPLDVVLASPDPKNPLKSIDVMFDTKLYKTYAGFKKSSLTKSLKLKLTAGAHKLKVVIHYKKGTASASTGFKVN